MEKIKKNFEPGEIRDLVIFILMTTLILTFEGDFLSGFGINPHVFIILIVIGVSVFLRVFSNKLMARRLGCTATFKLWMLGLVIGIISLFLKMGFGIIFLAIGYVEIVPYKFGRWGIKLIRMTSRDYGHIALAGVGFNLFLMLIFGVLYTTYPGVEIFQIVSKINGWLAFFSLLPVPPLEGGHILR
ncbi:MAG: hypothetical protein GF368_01290, partial [Candidatus Aenigmarchaeota archaeon]|nr:hypothetical protein [Candidatus Aenigmarchaeota archaeon]